MAPHAWGLIGVLSRSDGGFVAVVRELDALGLVGHVLGFRHAGLELVGCRTRGAAMCDLGDRDEADETRRRSHSARCGKRGYSRQGRGGAEARRRRGDGGRTRELHW
jgi:hypothetical protein